MLTRSSPYAGALALVAVLAACGEDRRAVPVGPPAFDVTSPAFINGSVLGPSGNVCDSLPFGAPLIVRPIDLATQSFAGFQLQFCPANTYSFFVAPGTYLLRAQLPADPFALGSFPWRTVTVPPVEVLGTDVARDLLVPTGTPLGGGATFDGQPLEGVPINVVYEAATGFAAAQGSSGPDGAWSEFFDRSPMRLQAGIRVVVTGCDQLLGSVGGQTPAGGFLFPNEAARVTCARSTAPSVAFSHHRTRVVVTPLAGDIGGLSPELGDQFGTGWGVQFPVNGGEQPAHGPIAASQLFKGGLIVGILPDRVLSGVSIDGYSQCAPECRDFGFDARMSFTSSPAFGTKVTWHYSDAPSVEGVGLKVVQKSYDGVPPADYVLFRFTFTNSRATTLTFFAGMFADWDIDDDPFDDVGATDLGGRLMYMTNAGGGTAAGSLILSTVPVSGNTFFTTFSQSMATYDSALAGVLSRPFVATPGDHRALHAVGPITLRRDKSAEMWIAIVAGEDQSQLLANAAAAAADVARRRGTDDGPDGASTQGGIWNGGKRQGSATLPTCKRGCAQ